METDDLPPVRRWQPAPRPVVPVIPEPIQLPDTTDITELAKFASPYAFKALFEVMQDVRAPANIRHQAATAIIDRAHGRPKQAMDVSGDLRVNVLANVLSNAMRITEQSLDDKHLVIDNDGNSDDA